MKFDVIIGNPPYNKNLVKKNHPVYNHSGMDNTREGHIGFYLHCLNHLKDGSGGVLEFINPGKFLQSISSENVRKFLFENYNVEEISFYDCNNVFPDVSISSIIVSKITKGKTMDVKVTTISGDTYSVNPNNMKNMIIPSFYNKTEFGIYEKMIKKVGYFPEHVSRNVGEYGKEGEKYFKDEKTEIYRNKVLTDIIKGTPVFKYTNLTNEKSNCWRVVGKEVGITYQTILESNILTNHTFYTIPVKNEKEGQNIIKYMITNLFKMFYKRFYSTFHISAWISYIPMVNFDFNTEEDLYEYFDFNEEEEKYMRNITF